MLLRSAVLIKDLVNEPVVLADHVVLVVAAIDKDGMRLGDRQSNQHDRNLQREFPSVDEIAVEEIRVVARRRSVDAEDLDKVAQLPVQVADDGEALGNHGRDVVDARLALEHLEILGEDDEHVLGVQPGVLVLFSGRHRLMEVLEHFEHRLEGQGRG